MKTPQKREKDQMNQRKGLKWTNPFQSFLYTFAQKYLH